jgi:hypothetical protein
MRMPQLQRWNDSVLGMVPISATQYLAEPVQLAAYGTAPAAPAQPRVQLAVRDLAPEAAPAAARPVLVRVQAPAVAAAPGPIARPAAEAAGSALLYLDQRTRALRLRTKTADEAVGGTGGGGGAPTGAELEAGVVTHSGAALLKLDRAAISAALPGRSAAYQSLSVTALAVLIDQALGIDAAAATAGALRYVRGSAAAVESALNDPAPSAALLLHGERPEQVVAVAEAGETMPQKSTLFAPKPPTGLLLLAHEINRVG